MTKTLPPGLQSHLDTGATTMAYCWQVVRRDGLVQGFTEHDEDVTFAGVTFLASAGFTASRVQQSLGLAADNLNVDGALSDATINEDDLAAGLYDNAEVTLYWVNWQDVSQRLVMDKGNIGEVTRRETAFSAEFRSMLHKLNQKSGRTYQRTCDAVLGDARCKVNLAAFSGAGAVTSIASGRTLGVSGLGAFAAGFFTYGVLTFTTGANAGLRYEVKSHAAGIVTLWDRPAQPVTIADAFTIAAGCPKDAGTCRTKFGNLANFRGFPHIPGNDLLSEYPREDDENLDGGSFFR